MDGSTDAPLRCRAPARFGHEEDRCPFPPPRRAACCVDGAHLGCTCLLEENLGHRGFAIAAHPQV